MDSILDIQHYHQRITQLQHDKVANYGRPYQQCTLSVMDTIADPDITFNADGVCHYYEAYQQDTAQHVLEGNDGLKKWEQTVEELKKAGKRKKYDCIIGLSGGVDSTYLCLLAKEYGLRPLVIHCDNSWNSYQAYQNIDRTIKELNFDFYTYLIHWEDFKALQLAYLHASVVDIETISDHAFMAVLHQQSRKWGVLNTLIGTNMFSEQVLPKSWAHNWSDIENIKDIYRQYGNGKSLATFPFLSTYQMMIGNRVRKMQFISPLNWLDYNTAAVEQKLNKTLGWESYVGKHTESTWTRFYQLYILPEKFNIDKRKAHLSNLIFSGQITRSEALQILDIPPYEPTLLQEDLRYVLNKLDLSLPAFQAIMNTPPRQHKDFKMQKSITAQYPVMKLLRKIVTK